MKQRIREAIENDTMHEFVKDRLLFGLFLKGGYEDLFSNELRQIGFLKNDDLIPQHHIKENAESGSKSINLDLGQIVNGEVLSFVEFGHQFSLQHNKNSALQKIKDDGKKRLQSALHNCDMYNVQIITDVVKLTIPESWKDYFLNRYNVNKSIEANNREKAENRINEIEATVNEFNELNNIDKGLRARLDIDNEGGIIQFTFLINGPYSFKDRKDILPQ